MTQPVFVTPYLPPIANRIATNWKRTGKPYFVDAFERKADECPNCQGVGFVILVLADRGPLRTAAPGKLVSTWFDGNGEYGKGYYTVSDKHVYTCPECKGLDRTGDKPQVLPPQDIIARLDYMLGRKEQLGADQK